MAKHSSNFQSMDVSYSPDTKQTNSSKLQHKDFLLYLLISKKMIILTKHSFQIWYHTVRNTAKKKTAAPITQPAVLFNVYFGLHCKNVKTLFYTQGILNLLKRKMIPEGRKLGYLARGRHHLSGQFVSKTRNVSTFVTKLQIFRLTDKSKSECTTPLLECRHEKNPLLRYYKKEQTQYNLYSNFYCNIAWLTDHIPQTNDVNFFSFFFLLNLKSIFKLSHGHRDLPDTDIVVCVASKECLSISRPCQRDTLGWFGLAACADHFLSKFIYDDLAFQILKESIIFPKVGKLNQYSSKNCNIMPGIAILLLTLANSASTKILLDLNIEKYEPQLNCYKSSPLFNLDTTFLNVLSK